MPVAELDQESNKSTKYETSENNRLENSDNKGYNKEDHTFGLFGFGEKNNQSKQIERNPYHSVENELVRPEYAPKKNHEELKDYLIQKYGMSHVDLKDIDLEVANKAVQELEYFEANFGELDNIKRIEPWDASGSEKARYNPDSMTLYIPKNMTMEDLKELAEDEYKKGNWSTDDPRGLLWHEYAHALTCFLIDNDDNSAQLLNDIESKLKNTSKRERIKSLSLYGFKNEFECISESLAEYSSGKTREFAETITKIVQKTRNNN